MDSIKQILNKLISEALGKASGINSKNANVITASRPEFGDYQANGVMAIAKQLKTNPRELAQKVIAELDQEPQGLKIKKFEVAGPGFINIHLDDSFLLERASNLVQQACSLIPATDDPQTIVVDYSSPNLAKEMHVGHLRGTIIGDCLVRVLEKQGHTIIRQNHVGDWGTQFGMLIAYMKERIAGGEDLPTQLADLETFYRAAKEKFDADSDFATLARASVVKLQSGDPQYQKIWQQFIEESLRHCEAVYQKLNITLKREDLKAESFYNPVLARVVEELEKQSLVQVSEGARCVFMAEFKGKDDSIVPVIVQKSDGGYLYATTDLAAAQYRSEQLHADRALYVVDARQSLHFEQIFLLARKAGLVNDDISLEHIAYGTMMGKDGRPFKTRSGDSIKLIELLDEAVKRAFALVSEKNPELDSQLKQQIAEKVGIASVKYADLSKNRTSDYIFDWSTMLSFEGNTAPYLMYAYARIKSILRKHTSDTSTLKIESVTQPEERALLLKVLQMPEIIDAVSEDCFPNQLCNYLYELAVCFMRFYEGCPILKAEENQRNSRLALAELTANALNQGLELLGIETLEQM